jgi:hypothetical protein
MTQRNSLNRYCIVLKNGLDLVFRQLMKVDPEVKAGSGMAKMCNQDLSQSPKGVDMKWIDAVVKMHGEKKAHQSQVMVAVKVTDQYMFQSMVTQIQLAHLHLCPLTAVDEEIPVLNYQVLARRIPVIGRDGAAGA